VVKPNKNTIKKEMSIEIKKGLRKIYFQQLARFLWTNISLSISNKRKGYTPM